MYTAPSSRGHAGGVCAGKYRPGTADVEVAIENWEDEEAKVVLDDKGYWVMELLESVVACTETVDKGVT